MTHFFQVVLRTSDVDAAAAFYARVLGMNKLPVVQLHAQAVARGARPHWLGFLEVNQVERAAASFAQRGAMPLAPVWVNPEGLQAAVMRDPGGAVVALAKPPAGARPAGAASSEGAGPEVLWYELNTADVERAKVNYQEQLGLDFKPALDLGGFGVFHPFAWQPGGEAVGSFGDIAGRPGVHPHWLFHFGVAQLGRALDAVRAGAGKVAAELTLPSGARIAVCDDPQGAAFALRERPARSGDSRL